MGKKAKKKATKAGKDELQLQGEGVNRVRIEELDELASDYKKKMKKRVEVQAEETPAKKALLAGMLKYAKDLPKDRVGTITYKNNDIVVRLKHGKDSLSVEDAEPEADESQLKD